MDILKGLAKGLRKALPRRPSLALAWPLLPAAGIAAFLLHGCQREFDSPYLPRSDDYVGPEWSMDGDGDGISDSVEKYAPGCGGDPEACLRQARENAGIAEGLDSVTARDLDLVAGGPPVAPGLAWHPPSAAAPYTLASDNPAAAAAADSLVRPVAPGKAVFTVTVRADTGPPHTARFRVTVRPAAVRVRGVKVRDMVISLLAAGDARRRVPAITWVPADATDKGYTLASGDPDVARVVGESIEAVRSGETRVTLTTRDGGRKDTFKVRVVWLTVCLDASSSCEGGEDD